MPECHKCPLNGRPTKQCLACPGPSNQPSHHGLSFISLQRLPAKELANLRVPDPEPDNPMADFMRFWIRLPQRTRDILAHVLANGSVNKAAIGRTMKISRQAVNQHLTKAIAENPMIRTVIARRQSALCNHSKHPTPKRSGFYVNP